jgi:hypothetical protein
MLELYRLLLQSEKFLNWKPEEEPDPPFTPDMLEESHIMAEKHYAPDELAELWGVSTETIRSLFREEPGVLKIGKTGSRYKRGYVTLRIPADVAERVHTRLSAQCSQSGVVTTRPNVDLRSELKQSAAV